MCFMQLLTPGHVITHQGSQSQSETYLYMSNSLFTSTILLDLIKQVLIYCDSFVIVWIKNSFKKCKGSYFSCEGHEFSRSK